MTGNLPFWMVLIFSQASVRSDERGGGHPAFFGGFGGFHPPGLVGPAHG
jgi:hypothetical protein